MDLAAAATLAGFTAAAVVMCLAIARQRRFDLRDVGLSIASFLAARNLPPAVVLCGYALYPDATTVPTKLRGLESFVSFAGLSLLLVSLVSIWNLLRAAYKSPIENDKDRDNALGAGAGSPDARAAP